MTPMGLVTIASLAHQGAHLILLVESLASPAVEQIVSLLRESSRNESIFAEDCDIDDLASITAFANKWNEGSTQMSGPPRPTNATAASAAKASAAHPQQTNQVHRLDVILFLPTAEASYPIGSFRRPGKAKYCKGHPAAGMSPEQSYVCEVLGRFHLVNSLLQSLLVLPRDRDIRIVTVVSPWYAAGVALFDAVSHPVQTFVRGTRLFQPWTLLGANSLRWIALSRELQRRLDMLADADERPRSRMPGIDVDESVMLPRDTAAHGKLPQRSFISSICVCPGFERTLQLSAFFNAVQPWRQHLLHTFLLYAFWTLFFPLFWFFGKSTSSSADSVVWAVSARLETHTAMLRRIALEERARKARGDAARLPPAQSNLLAALDVEDDALAQTWQGIRPGALYREGRLIRYVR